MHSREQLLKVLFSDRVDFVVTEEAATQNLDRERGFPKLSRVYSFGKRANFVAFSKTSLGERVKTLAYRFDAALQLLKQEGKLDSIVGNSKSIDAVALD